jgi:hypothetical protein
MARLKLRPSCSPNFFNDFNIGLARVSRLIKAIAILFPSQTFFQQGGTDETASYQLCIGNRSFLFIPFANGLTRKYRRLTEGFSFATQ